MIVLDTKVVSELMRKTPNQRVLAWVDQQQGTDLVITAVTAGELRAGVALLPSGRMRARFGRQVNVRIDETFAGCVLPFGAESSGHYGEIVARRSRAGTLISAFDAEIAAVCRSQAATLAPRNQRDFAGTGVDLVDPRTVE